jgi:hypothetical protein
VAEPTRVPIQLEDGTIASVPADQLDQAEVAGAERSTPEALRHAEVEQKYRGSFGKGLELEAGARIAGGLRGFTGGLSDKAIVALGGDAARERLNEYNEAAPILSKGSEISGILAPLAAGGVPGAAGRLARGIPGLVGEAGHAGEGVAASLMGRSALGRVASGAVAGGLEGAAYGAGQEVSESALGDHELTAQKLVAAAGHGFLAGATVGGALGGVAAMRAPATLEEKLTAMHPYRPATELARPIAEDAAPQSIAGYAEDLAGKKAFKALGGNAGEARALLRRKGQGAASETGNAFADDIEAQSGKTFGAHTVESAYEHSVKRVDDLGTKLGSMLEHLDAAKTGVSPDVHGLVKAARAELVTPNIVGMAGGIPLLNPGSEPIVAAVEKHLGDLEAAFASRPPTFAEWQKSRVLLDKTINFNARNASPATDALKQLRGMIEGELEAAGEKAAERAGTAFASEYKATKQLYGVMREARTMLEGKMARQEFAGRAFSLGDMMGAAKGALLGGAPGALIGGVAAHIARTRGDFIAADALRRASRLEVLGAASASTDRKLMTGVRGLLGPAGKGADVPMLPIAKGAIKAAAPMIAGKSAEEKLSSYRDRVKQLTAFQTNPALATQTLATRLGDLPTVAPKVAAAVTDTVIRGNGFLFSKMPPPRIDTASLTPQLEPVGEVSPIELSRFARYAAAVDDPLSVLESARNGDLTPESVEAVKTVYPRLYDRMREEVMTHLMTAEKPLTYEAKVTLGTLLDLPTDGTMTPDFRAAMSANYASQPTEDAPMGPGGAPVAPAVVGPMNITGYASGGDAIERGAGL